MKYIRKLFPSSLSQEMMSHDNLGIFIIKKSLFSSYDTYYFA